MRALVMGGTEFISVHLVQSLLAQGHEVAVFNRGRRVLPVPLDQHVLAGVRVAGRVAPVESPGRLLGVGEGGRVVVDASGRDEDGVRATRQGVEQRADVLPLRGRVGDVEDAVEAMATEPLAQAGVVLAIAGDGLYTSREALAAPPAVEHGDLMASRQERLHEVKADEFGAAYDECAHDGGILA
jgi:NAD(P)-dependent dehydrogenase (short-subunit alcohol dehydrogenase family)